MKKIIVTMMAALFINSSAFAQENKEQGKCCEKKCEQCNVVKRSAATRMATKNAATRSSTRRIS